MNDLVSIIVPIYKVERFVRKAIDSIIGQTYKNIEIILVDDGSPDGCPAICDEYRNMDERIKVIHKENGGLSSARNAGIDIATGKYIAFLDSDDILNENYIKVLYELCEKYDCDIAQCDFLMVNEESILLEPQQSMRVDIFNPKETMRDFCRGANVTKYWVAWNKLYRKELFENIRYPLGRIHEDMFTSHKLLWKSKRTAVTNLYLYYYLQREDSITGGELSVQERIDCVDALKEEMEFFREKELYDQYAFMAYEYYRATLEKCEVFTNELISAREIVLKLPQEAMLTKIRSVYSTLSADEKKSYEKIYGSRISETIVNTFGFPIEKVGKNCKIALYGAGKAGQSFYDQINENNYGEVTVWVDNGWKNYIRSGLPVRPIDALLKHDFDKLIIAIENQKVVEEVMDNLIGWGIDRDKIITEVPVYMDKGSKMRAEFIDETRKIERDADNRRWILMNTPDHDNLGDHLLTMGTIHFLNDFFGNEKVVEITGKQWDICNEDIVSKISDQDIIVIVGGGFMGDLWPVQDNRVKQIIEKFGGNKIIFFPQTFYYTDTEDSVMNYDINLYNNRKNILFLHREKNSYRFFQENVVKDVSRNRCYPDLALYLNDTPYSDSRRDILFCLRLDKESVNEDTRKNLLDIVSKLGKNVEIIDTVLDRSVLKSERQEEISAILTRVSRSELLITDRLHAMIMAAITGTPCIAFDNLSKKVSGVYRWIEKLDYVLCTDINMVDICLVQEYLAKGDNKYNRLIVEKEFREMAEFIRNWVEDPPCTSSDI